MVVDVGGAQREDGGAADADDDLGDEGEDEEGGGAHAHAKALAGDAVQGRVRLERTT